MIFDLLGAPLHFNLNDTIHDINIHPELIEGDIMINAGSIDGIQLTNISFEYSFVNSKFLMSDEIFTITGENNEGLIMQYNLTMSHAFDESGVDTYFPSDFSQAK